MINTVKQKKTNGSFPESDLSTSEKSSQSTKKANLSGTVERAEREIPTDAIGRIHSALNTWEEVAADDIINKAELARLQKLANVGPQNDIYHSFLEHIATSLQKQFDTTSRSLFSTVGLRLKLCRETISVEAPDKRSSLSTLFDEFGRSAPKLEPAEEVRRFKELKAMVDSGQASVATLLVDASRFQQNETITATLVLMLGLCRSPLDADLLVDFSARLVAKKGSHKGRIQDSDLTWVFTEACRRKAPLESLLLAHQMTQASPDYDSVNYGPTLIVKYRGIEEGDFDKLVAVVARDNSRDQPGHVARKENLGFAAALLSRGVPLDTALGTVRNPSWLTESEHDHFDFCSQLRDPIMQRLQNPKRYPTATQELAKAMKFCGYSSDLNHHTIYVRVLEALKQAKVPTDDLLDLLHAMWGVDSWRSKELILSSLRDLLDRKDLDQTQVDRTIEIAHTTELYSEQKADLFLKAQKLGLASPEVLQKAAQKLKPGPERSALLGIPTTSNLLEG